MCGHDASAAQGGVGDGVNMLAGVDIGGTKCAVSVAAPRADGFELLDREVFSTPSGHPAAVSRLVRSLQSVVGKFPRLRLGAIGISCGGPLDSAAGVIYSPPNLPGWDAVDVVTPFRDAFHVPVGLQNDANACALAEWQWGAGRGARNMIFLTFGTGMGAGLILNGQLYTGADDMAGEAGHIRLADEGPVGYGKAGSFEGFCSGGGIARLARDRVPAWLRDGRSTLMCDDRERVSAITAREVGHAAERGDALALQIMETAADALGRGLAILVDLLNPERIVIGSIYVRQRALLEPIALAALRREALTRSAAHCRVLPAELGENVGDYAGLAVAQSVMHRGVRTGHLDG